MYSNRREGDRSEPLAKSLDKHFLACAAAATVVVGVGAVEEAEAVVQYSGLLDRAVPVSITGLYIDIDGNLTGTAVEAPNWDFNLFNSNSATSQKRAALSFHPTARPSATVGVTTAYAYTSKLGAGVTVSAASTFAVPPVGYPYSILAYRSSTGAYDSSQWNGGVTDGFVGIRFTASDNLIHFGWMRLNVANAAGNYAMTLRDFGWETQAGVPIATGAGIPEPASLALGVLALGAVGIRPSRRRSA
jgi:hypothetical protein